MSKYEIPEDKTLTLNVYVDMQKTVFRTASLTGEAITATDLELRRVEADKSELGTRHRFISIEFVNAEDCGGDCKLNEFVLFMKPDAIKGKIYGD
jgi:hypothetical protein